MLAELKGITLFKYSYNFKTNLYTKIKRKAKAENLPSVKYLTQDKGTKISTIPLDGDFLNAVVYEENFRTDKDLVKVVETLGSERSSGFLC